MTSERTRRLRLLIALGAVLAGGWLAAHAALEGAARLAESRLGAWLWGGQEYRQILTPGRFADRGAPRLYVCGASVVREAFPPDVLERELPGWEVQNLGTSIGTLQDARVLLEYLAAAYGPEALPDALAVGFTPRMAVSLGVEESPVLGTIDRYGPRFDVRREGAEPELVASGPVEALRERLAFLAERGTRYANGLRALALAGRTLARGGSLDALQLPPRLTLSDYDHLPPVPVEERRERLTRRDGYWHRMHGFDFASRADAIRRDVRRLRALAIEHGIDLFAVLMPETSWNRAGYTPGVYETYRAILAEELADVPLLDLRSFLEDELFHDHCHASRAGARRLSRRLAELVAAPR